MGRQIGKTRGPAIAIDARDDRVRLDQELVVSVNAISVPHSNFTNLRHLRRDGEQIIEVRRGVVTNIHFRNDQHLSGVFNRLVIVADAAQHLHPATFEIVQIVGVVNTSLPVGFLVGDAELQLMS